MIESELSSEVRRRASLLTHLKEQLGHGVAPPLRPAPPVGRPAVADTPRRAVGCAAR